MDPAGNSTTYAYGGDGRIHATKNVYNGGQLAKPVSGSQGTSTLVSDAIGQLAEHVTATGSATWDLLDGLGSTIVGANGGSITQLDARWPMTDGWVKMSQVVNGVEVHYVRNVRTGAVDDFKSK